MKIPLRVNIYFFLFSKAGTITEAVGESVEDSYEFFKGQYDKGRALIEELIEEFEGSVYASSSEANEAILRNNVADLMATDMNFANRCGDMQGGNGPVLDLVRLAKNDPQALRDMMDFHGEQFTGVNCDASDGHTLGLPDDFDITTAVVVQSDQVAYHVPQGEERELYDELTGAGEGQVVAVLDTGVNSTHPDIADSLLGVFSMVPGEDGEDINGHGTHVFSTCCGHKDLSLSHKAKGISIKVLGGPRGAGQSNWIEAGFRFAREWRGPNGERVTHINGSLGGGGFHAGTEREMALCVAAGIIIVAASGNDGWRRGVDLVNFPAKSVHAITEGAIDRHENVASFTSGGPLVDACSPGVAVVGASHTGGRIALNGTSMATPVEVSKSMSTQSFLIGNGFARLDGTAEYRKFLGQHARDIFDQGRDDATGVGVLDVYETLLEKKPDDITGLSVLRLGSQVAAAIMFVLMFFGGSTYAQDAPTFDTVVTTYQRTDTMIGEKVISEGKPEEISVVRSAGKVLPVRFGDHTTAHFIGPDLEPAASQALGDGWYVLQTSGKHLAFAENPGAETIVVESPEPEFDLTTIAPMAGRLATAMDDAPTSTILRGAYVSTLSSLSGPELTFEAAESLVRKAAKGALKSRPWDSQTKDWANGFQRPLQAEFDRIGIADVETYRDAISEVVTGLGGTFQPIPSATLAPPAIIHEVNPRVCPGVFCP